jgi:hypothetical protein
MKNYLENTRHVGWTASGLLVVAVLLSWYTVSGPIIGTMSFAGIQTDDGKLALCLALALGVVAIFANRTWLGICGVLAGVYYGYEVYRVTTVGGVDSGASKLEQSFQKAFTVDIGFGIYLGLLVGLALIGWGLVLPYVQKRKGGEEVTRSGGGEHRSGSVRFDEAVDVAFRHLGQAPRG